MADETNKPGHNDDFSNIGGEPKPRRSQPRRPTSIGSDHDSFEGSELSSDMLESLADELGLENVSDADDFAEAVRRQFEQMEKQQIDLGDRLAKAQEEIHRHQAEIQNLHRRREKEIEDASKYAIGKFARDTVEVADNFERAIASVPTEAVHDNPVLKSLLDGVTMTERQFLTVMERHGVQRISPKDELFNPHHHQAVMEQEDRSVPAGTVLQVYQSGYLIADRVLRPAMVVVARGGPKPVKPEPTAENETAPPPDAVPQDQASDTADTPTDGPGDPTPDTNNA